MKKAEWFFLLMLLAGFVLRTINIGNRYLFYDEKITVFESFGITNETISQNKSFTNHDILKSDKLENVVTSNIELDSGNGFLYPLTFFFLKNIFGHSVFFYRLVASLFGVLLIVLAFRFSRLLSLSPVQQNFVIFFFTVHALFISQSEFVRGYAAATFFSFLASYYLLKIHVAISPKWSDYIFYIFAVVAGFFIHFFTLYIIAAHVLFLLIFERRIIVWKWMIGCSFIFLAFVWLWYVEIGIQGLKNIAQLNLNYHQQSVEFMKGLNNNAFVMPATFINILKGWIQVLLAMSGNRMQDLGISLAKAGVFFLLPLLLILSNLKKVLNGLQYKILVFLFLCFLCYPVFATLLAIQSGHIISFQITYCCFSAPYCLLLMGMGVTPILKLNGKMRIVGIVALALILLINTGTNVVNYKELIQNKEIGIKNEFEKMADEISSIYKAGDTISYSSINDALLINLYLPKERTFYGKIIDDHDLVNDYVYVGDSSRKIKYFSK